ncbi:MAG: serine/threonine-protein kinase [Polyangiales bacterium]
MKNPVKFGKYYLLERISVGGMAEVFKAKSFGEAGFERLVAVKRILPSIAEDQEFIAMFVDEAKLAVQLTHPNIAQIFELGKVAETYFIALEYVGGKDLRAIFERAKKRGEPIPVPMACYLVMKLCEGLDYAHNKKDSAGRALELVHRDVSPQNILVSYDGDVKLIDFGIAKAASKSSKTQAGILKGKFGYMSPEQVRGLQVDRRSDVFAVGICLYELLTMERLFVGESDFSTLEKVRNVEIMPPTSYNRKVPDELEAIVLKALAKHPEDRYRTAMDLHDDLQSFMYTSGNFFARKDLSTYQHRLFAEEIAKEAARDDEYRKFDSSRATDLEELESSVAAPAGPPPPLPGRSAAAPANRTPPPPPPRGPRSTTMGVGPSAAAPVRASGAAAPPPPMAKLQAAPAAPSPGRSGPHSAASEELIDDSEMEWDDEELATQVYDKPESLRDAAAAMRALPPAARAPAARAAVSAAARSSAVPALPSLPGAGGLPSLPGARVSAGGAPPPSSSLPAAPSSSLPIAAPAIPAPAVAPPPAPPVASAPPAPAAPISSPAPAAKSDPFTGVAPGFVGPSVSGAGSQQAPYRLGAASSPARTESIRPEARRKDSSQTYVLAGLGIVAIAAAVVIGLKLTRGESTGGLLITTNVGGVSVSIDSLPQIGNGQSFTVTDLPVNRVHHVEVRKQGFRTYVQDVPVREGQITPMQVVLEPEPAPLAVPPLPGTRRAPRWRRTRPPQVQQLTPPPRPLPGASPGPAPAPVAEPAPAPRAPTPAPRVTVAAAPRATSRRARRALPRPSPPGAEPPAPAPAAAAGGGGDGTLLLSTRPASQCTIAGRGGPFSTPRRLTLPAGSYRISCVNEEMNSRATFSVTIPAGGTADYRNRALE